MTGFVSLGCPKALVDSERILTQLRAEGYTISPGYDAADVVVVNTCGFLDSAKPNRSMPSARRSRKTAASSSPAAWARGGHDPARRIRPCSRVTGPQQYEAVGRAVHDAAAAGARSVLDLVPPQGLRLTPRHYAYLKISEGCNHRCTFCIIPSMRGDLVSRPVGDGAR